MTGGCVDRQPSLRSSNVSGDDIAPDHHQAQYGASSHLFVAHRRAAL